MTPRPRQPLPVLPRPPMADAPACARGVHCATCRADTPGGRSFRASAARAYAVPAAPPGGPPDAWPCPHGLPMGFVPPPGAPAAVRAERRPAPTLAAMASFTRAALGGRYVAAEVVAARAAACAACAFLRRDSGGTWCGACGCAVSAAPRRVRNLAAYAENLPHWGCKHPGRAAGRGWPR